MPHIVTTLGVKTADELGMILPHEHVFVDLRTCDKPGYGQAGTAAVIAMMQPEIEKIKTSVPSANRWAVRWNVSSGFIRSQNPILRCIWKWRGAACGWNMIRFVTKTTRNIRRIS